MQGVAAGVGGSTQGEAVLGWLRALFSSGSRLNVGKAAMRPWAHGGSALGDGCRGITCEFVGEGTCRGKAHLVTMITINPGYQSGSLQMPSPRK